MEPIKLELKKEIKNLYRGATKNKALLSFKYDNLNRKISFVQVSVIVASTVITFIESLKSQYEYDSVGWDIVPIVLASYIALIMAILRFYKWEETKERVSNCHDNHVFISNKLIKINNSINKFDFNTMPYEDWKNLISVYENEIFVNVVTVKESFESLMRYKDLIYYKNKFRKMYLKHEIINNEIDTVTKSKHLPLSSFRRLICCPFKSSIKYSEFFRKMDGLEDDNQNEEPNTDSQMMTRQPVQEYEYTTTETFTPRRNSIVTDSRRNSSFFSAV